LLTVVMHEMGHVLGLEHSQQGVMQESLALGIRHPFGCSCPACMAAALAAQRNDSATVRVPLLPPLQAGQGTALAATPSFDVFARLVPEALPRLTPALPEVFMLTKAQQPWRQPAALDRVYSSSVPTDSALSSARD